MLTTCAFGVSGPRAGLGSRWGRPLRTVLVLAAWLASSAGSVVRLTSESLGAAVNTTRQGDDSMMVKFFAPWCGHCKVLAPKYEEAADIIAQEGYRRQPHRAPLFAEVDAATDPTLASMYGLQGYPALLVFSAGTAATYSGPREASPMAAFMRATLGKEKGSRMTAGRSGVRGADTQQVVRGPAVPRTDMPSLRAMDPTVRCDACLTTVELFLATWKGATSKVMKEQGSTSRDLTAGIEGPQLNINKDVTGEIEAMCTKAQLGGHSMPEYVRETCLELIGDEDRRAPFRFRLQRALMGQHWIQLPAIKHDICEKTAELCTGNASLAPIPLATATEACTFCQEVVSDLHFMARRMRLRRWEREPFLTDMLEEVCLSGDMRHQSTTKLHRKQLACEEVRDALEDEHRPLASRYFAQFGAMNAQSWFLGKATDMPPLGEAVRAICVGALGWCPGADAANQAGKTKTKTKKKQKKRKKKSE